MTLSTKEVADTLLAAERRQRFIKCLSNLPEPGAVLVPKDNQPIILNREDDSTFSVKFTANACVDQEATGWYLTNEPNGLRVLILPARTPKYREALKSGKLSVDSIKITRVSRNGKSLLGEVNG